MRVPVQIGRFSIGQALPWDLITEDGRRVFRKGFVINTEASLKRILDMNLFYIADEVPGEVEESTAPEPEATPAEQPRARRTIHYDFLNKDGNDIKSEISESLFSFLDYCIYQQQMLSDAITSKKTDQAENVYKLIENIETIYELSPDACLGAIHIEFEEHPYSSLHPVYAAILCRAMASALNLKEENRRSLLGAALTANLGMYDYHDRLVNTNAKLTDKQFEILRKHPQISCDLVQANGITDSLWNNIIIQSHERLDGSGYPNRLTENDICLEAKIYAAIDTYLAMVMPRAYRAAMVPKIAMQKIYETAVSEKNVLSFGLIKTLGIYPPGSFVQLANREIAIVIKRNLQHSVAPEVAVIASSSGRTYREITIRKTDSAVYKIIDAYTPEQRYEINLDKIWRLTVDDKTIKSLGVV